MMQALQMGGGKGVEKSTVTHCAPRRKNKGIKTLIDGEIRNQNGTKSLKKEAWVKLTGRVLKFRFKDIGKNGGITEQ